MWSVALAHRRLKVIDLSGAGHQPMVDGALGLTIVFNGCIYNYPELRAELEAMGYAFFSHSDTEVILKAYARWGRMVRRAADRDVLLCDLRARQRPGRPRPRPAGVKPLYLADTAGALRFGSTLPALLAGGGIDTRSTRSPCTTTSAGTPSSRPRARS